ncbi:hypothetical protein ABBQ32_005758 [Trebouxia sp. C0010 RCD-2024]
MEGIASQRAVQLSTVQSYIAEAMAAGYTYPWHRMKVPFSMLASLCAHMRAYHKQQLLSGAPLPPKQPGDMTQMQDDQQQAPACQGAESQALLALSHQGWCAGAGGLQHGGQNPHHHPQQQQQQNAIQHDLHQARPQQAAAVKVHSAGVDGDASQPRHGTTDRVQSQVVCSRCALLIGTESASLQPDGGLRFQHGSGSPAQVGSQRLVQLPDMQLVRELVVTSKGTKALQDSMDTLVLSYGHMRLALAHIYCLLRHHICFCLQT